MKNTNPSDEKDGGACPGTQQPRLVLDRNSSALVVPFMLNQENLDNSPNFRVQNFSSLKLNALTNEGIYNGRNDTNNFMTMYNYVGEVVKENDICNISSGKNTYEFKLGKVLLMSFDLGVGMLQLPIEILSCNGRQPCINGVLEALDVLTRVRYEELVCDNALSGVCMSVKAMIKAITGNIAVRFIGHNRPITVEERPKIVTAIALKNQLEERELIITGLSAEALGIFRNNTNTIEDKEIILKRKEYHISRNATILLEGEGKETFGYFDEYVLCYEMCIYEYMANTHFLEEINLFTKKSLLSDDIDSTCTTIRKLKQDYALFKVKTSFPTYANIDSLNTATTAWKKHYSRYGDGTLLESKLKDLGEMADLIQYQIREKNEKITAKKRKNIEISAVFITSILSFFVVFDGVFRLFDRATSLTLSVVSCLKVVFAVVIWCAVLIVSLKKTKS